jgi:hypothetical protein
MSMPREGSAVTAPARKFLDSLQAATYLGYKTREGIRHLVYSGGAT